jgi:hypothetical protein
VGNEERRNAIRDRLYQKILEYFNRDLGVYDAPAIDVEVRPLEGSGYSLDQFGKIQMTWP